MVLKVSALISEIGTATTAKSLPASVPFTSAATVLSSENCTVILWAPDTMYWSSWLTMIPEPQLSCGCDAVYPYQVLTCFSLIFVIATIDGITLSAISETSVKSVTALDEVFAALTVSPLLLLFREASVLADSELLHFVPSS